MPANIRITIGERALEKKTYGKFLGVFLDEELTFRDHIQHISKKVSKLTGLMFKLKQFFPLDILRSLYFSLIYPYFTYCILAWGGVPKTLLQQLVLHQKKLVRILSDSDFYAHTTPLFKQLKILKLEDLYGFHVQLIMYKTFSMNVYPDMKNNILNIQANHRYTTRLDNFRTSYCRIDKCKQCLYYQGVKHWNLLPEPIKEKKSIFSFKSECKNYYLCKY